MGIVTATFTLTRDKTSELTSVNYATQDDTAFAGIDYVKKSGVATFDTGSAECKISIDVMTRPKGTPDKKFRLVLSNPSEYGVLLRAYAVCTITTVRDLPVISISDAVIEEYTG